MRRTRLLLLSPSLGGGGAERHMLRILPWLREAFEVELATLRAGGELAAEVPPEVPVVRIGSLGWIAAARRLRAHIGRTRPDLVLSFQEAASIPLLLARRTLPEARRPACAVSVQSAPSVVLADARLRTRFRVATAIRWLYPSADRIIVASAGVTRDLDALVPAASARCRVIFNAGMDAGIDSRAAEPWTHRFLAAGAPILVACGRLTEQKDYTTLLRATAMLAAARDVRLIVFGDGPLRAPLAALARDLGIDDRVDFAGYVANPYPGMARADLFVLSSRSEGFGNVLVEALALGLPIVSTDCPHGPREILDAGAFGRLVAPGEPPALAAAMAELLDDPRQAAALGARGPARAARYSAERSGQAYVAALREMLTERRR